MKEGGVAKGKSGFEGWSEGEERRSGGVKEKGKMAEREMEKGAAEEAK